MHTMLGSSIRLVAHSKWKRRLLLTTRSSSIPPERSWLTSSSSSADDDAQPPPPLSLPATSLDTVKPTTKPMDLRLLYRYFHLETFTETEIHTIFDKIRNAPLDATSTVTSSSQSGDNDSDDDPSLTAVIDTSDTVSPEQPTIDMTHVQNYLLQRIQELEQENAMPSRYEDESVTDSHRRQFAHDQASQLLQVFSSPVTKERFTSDLIREASAVDVTRTLPIAISMLLVGSSVGIITPVMPFVVEHLGLSPGQYGVVVSAFAVAKMAGNVPSAILVERHGRKPYLVYSLSVIALGVGGIGLATQFEHLWVCRMLTGIGVAALSTAATMTIADISTPRNRASTMAPIMSAFAAGTALGPAIGGVLADQVGINPTFYIVGISYLGLTVVNNLLLTETKSSPMVFPWQQADPTIAKGAKTEKGVAEAISIAVGQWAPLMSDARVRNVVIMNGFYWVALAGSQMTLLPLMLTDPTGLAMSATGVGQVYMGMSLVQVMGNPILAKFVDKMGKGPAIVVGCSLIAGSMAMLPLCSDMYQLASALGVWATGSTMLSTAPVAYISDTVDDEKRAQAIALLRTSGDVGFLLGATGMGALADWTGNMDVAMQTSAGVLLTATGWFAARQFLNSKLVKQNP